MSRHSVQAKPMRAQRTLDRLVGRTVWLRCRKPGCPRKRKLRADEMAKLPAEVACIVSPCPWHEGNPGDFMTEEWYDRRGRDVSHLCSVEPNKPGERPETRLGDTR